jgi:hypothetical protein
VHRVAQSPQARCERALTAAGLDRAAGSAHGSWAMSDERPNPLTDVLKGLGLLLRAAKTTVERLPTKDLEQVVLTSAREVGRAIENVATTVEREVFGRKDEPTAQAPRSPEAEPPSKAKESDKEEPKPPSAA